MNQLGGVEGIKLRDNYYGRDSRWIVELKR